MLIRLVQFAIVIFWLTMTFFLFRVVFFPDETRLTEVPPAHVFERFVYRRESYGLLILDGGKEIGSLVVSPRRVEGKGAEGGAEIILGGVLDLGVFAGREGDPPMGHAGRLRIDGEGRLEILRFELRFPHRGALPVIEAEPKARRLEYKVIDQGKIVLDSEEVNPAPDSTNAEMLLLIQAMGINVGAAAAGRPVEEYIVANSRARHGNFKIRGQEFSGYLAELPLPTGQTLRLIFTKSGELMKIDGIFNFEMLSDFFRASTRSGVRAPR